MWGSQKTKERDRALDLRNPVTKTRDLTMQVAALVLGRTTAISIPPQGTTVIGLTREIKKGGGVRARGPMTETGEIIIGGHAQERESKEANTGNRQDPALLKDSNSDKYLSN